MSDSAYTFALAVIALVAVAIILACQYRLDTDQRIERASRGRVLRELARHDDEFDQ